jgi:hypothetical protein
VYTLYSRRSGSLFVHALDSVDRHAFCVDLPRKAPTYWRPELTLTPGKLVVGNSAKRLAVIDTRTLRLVALRP